MPKVSEAYVQERRQRILAAASACFAENGYHDTTMQDIASEAGVSYGVVYRYFDSKESILRAMFERSQQGTGQLIGAARETGVAGALSSLAEWLAAALSAPDAQVWSRVNLEVLVEVLKKPDLLEALKVEPNVWRRELGALFEDARTEGLIDRDIDPVALAVLIISAYEGLRTLRLIDAESFRPEFLLVGLNQVIERLAPKNT